MVQDSYVNLREDVPFSAFVFHFPVVFYLNGVVVALTLYNLLRPRRVSLDFFISFFVSYSALDFVIKDKGISWKVG